MNLSFRSAWLGTLSAGFVVLVIRAQEWIPARWLLNPWSVVMVSSVAAVVSWGLFRRRWDDALPLKEHSLVDFLVHIHHPSRSFSVWFWAKKAVFSFLFAICGGRVGPEGFAAEGAHAAALLSRQKSSHWSENQRRRDASISLAAAFSASLGSPLAAILLPIELGVGGSLVGVALASLCAKVVVEWSGVAPNMIWPTLEAWTGWRDGVAFIAIGVAAGVLGILAIQFISYAQQSFASLFPDIDELRLLMGGALLGLVALAHPPGVIPANELIKHLISTPFSPLEASLLGLSFFLVLTIICSAIGTTGVFWPIFALGCLVGYVMEPVFPGYPRTSMVAGGAALFATLLGAPLTATLLAFELTQQWTVIVPCLLTSAIALGLRKAFRMESLIGNELLQRGVELEEGRSRVILDSLVVRKAMVEDYQKIHENESLAELRVALQKSRYPFVVVVNARDEYSGLLTADQIIKILREKRADKPSPLDPILKGFMEAKDLVYRSKDKIPCVQEDDKMSEISGVFDYSPAVPVVNSQRQVTGLLFLHEVRIAYDRELAKRSFLRNPHRD